MKKHNPRTPRTKPEARREGGPDQRSQQRHKGNAPQSEGNGKRAGKKKYLKKAHGKKSEANQNNRTGRAGRNASGQERKAQPPQYDFKKIKTLTQRRKIQNTEGQPETIRLNRFIANAGVCSRREADGLIAEGKVTVNGKVVTELGMRVNRDDKVRVDKKLLQAEKMVYVLLNKPKDYITTTDDPQQRRTVMELVGNACNERIVPVGRLDRYTTGLLLFTNDGELAKKLTHPSHKVKKLYQVELSSPITRAHMEQVAEGVKLDDGMAYVNDLAIVTPDRKTLGIEIHIGRNRIVRRIFEHLGYHVDRLDRTVFAGLTKKDLARGQWRYLTEKEVIRLKMIK